MTGKRILMIILAALLILTFPAAAFAQNTENADTGSRPSPLQTDSAQPGEETPPVQSGSGALKIDSEKLYDGMNKTYSDGYIPATKGEKATIILPLLGEVKGDEVILTVDLGTTDNSPFVFGNYSQTKTGKSPYVFTLDIPLASGRINGSYPVTLNASYLDLTGAMTTQTFIIYVTITDGADPVDPNVVPADTTPAKETVEKPELFISKAEISPGTVGGNEEFTVDVTVENIGTLKARSVRLTYGGDLTAAGGEGGSTSTIIPVETNNSIHLDNIGADGKQNASFKLKTTKDTLAGSQPFSVTLDYLDAYGNVYTSSRQFLVNVSQPAEISYDPIAPPKEIAAGETFSLPANVFNIGKSTLRNVSVTVTGAGLFPTSSVFLGDIAPGGTGNGEISIFAGQLSMTEGYTEDYGKSEAVYTITYTDDAGAEQTIETPFTIEIKEPVIEGEKDETELTEEPAFQWWVTILVGCAMIAVIVAVAVVTKTLRAAKIKK